MIVSGPKACPACNIAVRVDSSRFALISTKRAQVVANLNSAAAAAVDECRFRAFKNMIEPAYHPPIIVNRPRTATVCPGQIEKNAARGACAYVLRPVITFSNHETV